MILKVLKYLGKEFSNAVRNRIHSSSGSTNSLQEYMDSNNLNNEDIREDTVVNHLLPNINFH